MKINGTYHLENAPKNRSFSKRHIIRPKFNDITDDYNFLSKIPEKGSYGIVFIAKNKESGKKCAIKCIKYKKKISDDPECNIYSFNN